MPDDHGELDASASDASEGTGSNALGRLAGKVVKRIGRPVDPLAVTVALEARGWRDVDAQEEFGAEDLFELSERLYPICRERTATEPNDARPFSLSGLGLARLRDAVLRFARGLLVSVPVVGQIAAVLTLGYSLWAWMYFTEAEATVVALGTLGSFVVTGGFIQCIGREGHRYLASRSPREARRACTRLTRAGLTVVGTLSLAALVVNAVFPFYPFGLLATCLLYFILLSALWLVVSVLYVLDQYLAIAAFTLAGLAPVAAVVHGTEWGIYAAHALGIALSVALGVLYAAHCFRRLIRDQSGERERSARTPRVVEFHDLLPYFLYGTFLFGLVFVDRVIAWSVTEGDPSPYLIWFRTPYELGLDWALFPFLLVAPIVEYATQEFADWFSPSADRISDLGVEAATDRFRSLYRRHLGLIVVVGMLGVAGVYAGVLHLVEVEGLAALKEIVAGPITRFVYTWASVSYVAVAVGLYHVLLFFSLGRPWFAVRSVGSALGANVVVGFGASRAFGYEYAVAGLFAGALVFAGQALWYGRTVVDRFSYYRYSAH